ncbi:MAG: hypothetical protein HON65_13280, partial [Rhodospirillales bacterium]|nr:hypothetical protein [Rhodospirillales bacterium]
TNIRAILGGMDLPELLADFNIIDDRADHDPVLISEQDKNKTRTMYINLAQKVESMSEDAALRSKITELLHIHNTVMDTMIDTKARLEVVPQSVDDIIEYIVPSLREISDFGEQLSRVSPVTYEREYVMVRKILAAGSTIIVVVVVVVGLILMRSITSPVTRISEAVMRLVNGDRALSIPLQGNADAVGDMARSLDKWLDNLAEIEHLRAELDDTRMRLTLGAIAEAVENPDSNNNAERDEPENEIVVEQMADEDDLPEKDAPEGVEDFGQRALQPQPPFEPAPLLEIARHSGDEETIGAATRQLNQYNANVTEAAKEVERTETLINLLSGATQQIAGLEVCISSIRDEANLMVFNAITPSNGSGTEKALLELPGDEDNQQPSKLPDQRHKNDGRRFEVLRSKAGNAEQMIDDILSSIDAINNVAHEIATAASAEALEATSKLLSQSERLQTMLDELVNKVGPLSKKSEEL